MMDCSSREESVRLGKHAQSIDVEDFKKYVPYMQKYNFDVILEIKDKEKSALKAISSINRN
jgi:UV DNA damage endonuclease